MYIRTPKRYRSTRRPRRYLFNLRWLWLWLLTPVVAYFGVQIYNDRAALQPQVQEALDQAVESITGGLATAVAPTPTARPDPSQALAAADGAWQSGAIEEALNAYKSVLPDIPNDMTRHYIVTLGLLLDGRIDEAVEMAERTVSADPYSPDAWAIRAYALTEDNQPAEAIASALQALSLQPNHARSLAYLAYAYYENNQIERAAELVARALESDPESPDAYYVSGLLNNYSRFDFAAARRDFETALQYAPNLITAKIEIAYLQMRDGLNDDARTSLLEVTELNPNNLDALYALGFLYSSAFGDPDQAVQPLQRCVDLDGRNRACLFLLGNVQSNRGDVTGALNTYRQLMASGTQDPRHFLATARAYITGAGDCESAVDLLRDGYALEQAAFQPNLDRLAAFEELLLTCGSAGFSVPTAEPTPEQTPGA